MLVGLGGGQNIDRAILETLTSSLRLVSFTCAALQGELPHWQQTSLSVQLAAATVLSATININNSETVIL